MKSTTGRSSDEIQHIMLHLMFKVPFFQSFKRKLITSICEKLEHKVYLEGENLMVEGEIGDKMFILFSGKVNVLIKKVVQNEIRYIVAASI